MLSQEVLQLVNRIVKQFVSVKMQPTVWDSSKNRLRGTTYLKEILPFLVHQGLNIIFVIPIILLGPKICIDNRNNISGIVIPVLELLCVFFVVILQIGFFTYRHEFVAFANKFLQHELSYGKYVPISIEKSCLTAALDQK